MYIGGQDAVNTSGEIVGKGDIREQVRQIFVNLQGALKAAGAGLEHVVKWNVYVVEGHPLEPGYEVFRQVWGRPSESAGDHRDLQSRDWETPISWWRWTRLPSSPWTPDKAPAARWGDDQDRVRENPGIDTAGTRAAGKADLDLPGRVAALKAMRG